MREPIYDNDHTLIGYIKETSNGQEVFNKNSRLLGYVKEDGTYDKNNRRVSQSKVPGLLLE